ncbi:molybdopterin-dependent oxidoreductase [Planosporangium thailandense]|uniref:Molybdopterin-dependent oxidoreductase n=1 Tax=Planosporangium thailandense TaxID=765197 RepID=A0ABX0Y1T5_9ACTN|nr:molybdopterin-dependent oxidoreductase [Planosporangium thailandense]NJC72041.1 molybdopterin-dependent oxidoreductase [Planosporangium thailandense]
MRLVFRSVNHDVSVSARLGRWLGVAFALCFLTGLASHAVQHTELPWPTRPVGLYRVTQGVHVLSGVAAVPLLLAKLWSVYPKLFERPRLRTLPERGAVLVLIAAAFFELVTGGFNVAKSYPWSFFFPTAHYAVAWILAGGLLVHIGLRLPAIHTGLATPVDPRRRAFLRTTGLAAGAALLATAGGTVPLLRRVSLLAWRSPTGVPVNRTAAAAGISIGPDWRLTVGSAAFTYADLLALPQHTATLPIACVEGWSASATWSGVRVRDLLAAAGVPVHRPVRVISLDEGRYGRSTLPTAHVNDPLTLLALRMNGRVLSPDHGYPCRLITASRPGVLQTKWVSRIEAA